MICKQCGSELREGAVFCSNCGAKQVTEEIDFEKTVGTFNNVPENTGAQPINTQESQPYQQPYQNSSYQNNPYQNNPYQNNPYQNNPYQNNPYQNAPYQQNSAYDRKVGFIDAVKIMFQNYANFRGRSSRSEYWWAFLFNFLASFFVVGAISAVIPPIGGACSIALMIPGLALTVRRLHDTGKSWVYMLIGLIPLVGSILLIIRLTKPSDGPNQWG